MAEDTGEMGNDAKRDMDKDLGEDRSSSLGLISAKCEGLNGKKEERVKWFRYCLI